MMGGFTASSVAADGSKLEVKKQTGRMNFVVDDAQLVAGRHRLRTELRELFERRDQAEAAADVDGLSDVDAAIDLAAMALAYLAAGASGTPGLGAVAAAATEP